MKLLTGVAALITSNILESLLEPQTKIVPFTFRNYWKILGFSTHLCEQGISDSWGLAGETSVLCTLPLAFWAGFKETDGCNFRCFAARRIGFATKQLLLFVKVLGYLVWNHSCLFTESSKIANWWLSIVKCISGRHYVKCGIMAAKPCQANEWCTSDWSTWIRLRK